MSGKKTRTVPLDRSTFGIDRLEFGEDAPGLIRQVAHLPGFDPRQSGRFIGLQEQASAADLLYRTGHLAYSKIKSIEYTIVACVELLLSGDGGAR